MRGENPNGTGVGLGRADKRDRAGAPVLQEGTTVHAASAAQVSKHVLSPDCAWVQRRKQEALREFPEAYETLRPLRIVGWRQSSTCWGPLSACTMLGALCTLTHGIPVTTIGDGEFFSWGCHNKIYLVWLKEQIFIFPQF